MPFAQLVADLAGSVLGTDVEYERASAPGTWVPLRALIGSDVEVLELGAVRSASPVATVELPRSAVTWDPARGDRIRWGGDTWVVDEPPTVDRLGVAIRLHVHREEA